MHKNRLALPFFFIFFIFFSSSVFAYHAVDLNVTVTAPAGYTNPASLRCSNLTNTAWCYLVYSQGIQRFNTTNLSENGGCAYGTSFSPYLAAIINSTDIWLGPVATMMYNLTDMTGACDVTKSSTDLEVSNGGGKRSQGACYNNEYCYWPMSYYSTNHNGISKFKDNETNQTGFAGYWGDYQGLAMPDPTDNSTIYVANITAGSLTDFYKYVNGTLQSAFPSIETTFGVVGTSLWDILKEADGFTYLYFYNGGRIYKANLTEIEGSSYADCNSTQQEGTTCTGSASYMNYRDCVETYGTCPTGDRCVPLTPQYNASYGLTENIADCSHCYFLQQWNFTSSDYSTIRTNCANAPECLLTGIVAEDVDNAIIWRVVYGNGVYHYNATIPAGVTASISKYTIYCQKADGSVDFVVDEYGTTGITESEFLYNETKINISAVISGQCPNTTSTCYDAACQPISCYVGEDAVQATRNWVNSSMGTPFGADIIALISAGVIAIWAFMLGKDDKDIKILLGTFMVVAGAFAFIGFLTVWFLVVEVATIFVMVFWKVKQGG